MTTSKISEEDETPLDKQNQTSWEKLREAQIKRSSTQTEQKGKTLSRSSADPENQTKTRKSSEKNRHHSLKERHREESSPQRESIQTETNFPNDPCCCTCFENIKIKCYERCQKIVNANGSSIERIVEIVSDIGGKYLHRVPSNRYQRSPCV